MREKITCRGGQRRGYITLRLVECGAQVAFDEDLKERCAAALGDAADAPGFPTAKDESGPTLQEQLALEEPAKKAKAEKKLEKKAPPVKKAAASARKAAAARKPAAKSKKKPVKAR